MNSIIRTSGSVSTFVSKTSSYRNELLNGVFAAIDIEYYKNDSKRGNRKPPYTIFAVSIVDSNLTIGWYTKGVETIDEE